ncbi:uncharacterized protein BCR38DRAFT_483328 [Pseudomassariella vexata]|uniref:Myb-like domain-containing protein n=1 Tax=Pseudomassariella vexata TaxID=1141098 RepID=A0A1Y2E837_9PEZI|nr:uncharacterized protein BCR38DRAFT_483328 [Pseudomassariella vexata]ORY67720.1 hypothetical protein BCR38DRAFT_483328 [Pseudomassariella vexata]
MTGRRGRAGGRGVSQEAASAELPTPRGPQTRSTRRAEASKLNQDPVPRRGAPRASTVNSIPSVATTDFPRSSYPASSPPSRKRALRPSGSPASKKQRLSSVAKHGRSLLKRSGPNNGPRDGNTADEARTNAGATAPEMIPEEVMEDIMDDTIRSSSKLYEHIISLGARKPTDNWRSRLQYFQRTHNSVRSNFVAESEPFISSEAFERNLPYEVGTKSFLAAKKVICFANLASLLRFIVDLKYQNKPARPILEELDRLFPNMFDPFMEDITSSFDLAFRIRCCNMVATIKDAPDSNRFLLAAASFCDDEVESPEDAQQLLLMGPFKPVANVDVNSDQDYLLHMADIYSYLFSNTRAQMIKDLENAYPLEDLLRDLEDWLSNMFPRLYKGKAPVHTPLLATDVIDQEEDSMFVDEDDNAASDSGASSDSDSEPEEEIIRTGAPIESFLDDKITLETVVQKQRRATPPSNQQANRGLPAIDPRKLLGLDFQEARSSLGQNMPRLEAVIREPQESHERPGPKGPHPTVDGEEDVFGDEYQTDVRPTDESRRIPKLPTPNRAHFSRQTAASKSERSPSLGATPGQEYPERLVAGDLMALSQKAKAISRIESARQAKGPQKRTFWTLDDNKTLISAIPKYQCSWAAIEDAGLFSVFRTQQQIRDRARNLKVDFLKADVLLPAGFDGVCLGKKEREAVIKCRRNPDRTEEDVDEDGTVINTIYDPEVEDPFA